MITETKPTTMHQDHTDLRTAHKEYLVCKRGSVYVPMKCTELYVFYVIAKVTFVKDQLGNKYTIESSLAALESQLDPKVFFRANRKVILNVNSIVEYKMIGNGKIDIVLKDKDFKSHVTVSQVTAPHFKKWIAAL